MSFDHTPDDLVVDAVVAVAEDVADRRDVGPGDLRAARLEVVRDATRSLRDDLNPALGREPQPTLAQIVL
jgi:hypothetical protein